MPIEFAPPSQPYCFATIDLAHRVFHRRRAESRFIDSALIAAEAQPSTNLVGFLGDL